VKVNSAVVLALISFWSFGVTLALAKPQRSVCKRTPEMTEVDPHFYSKDPCVGNVKIQGIAFKCGQLGELTRLNNWHLREFQVKGQKRCEDFCKKRSPGCRGIFRRPSTCGWKVPANIAVKVGRETAGCHSKCEGEAFIYCSIYHASYLRIDPSQFRDKVPNCSCIRGKKKK
jgi:hypothetical protein